ncbi:MAG: hypothetical protein AAFU55_12240, partial [Pseudomonadota bacterium]
GRPGPDDLNANDLKLLQSSQFPLFFYKRFELRSVQDADPAALAAQAVRDPSCGGNPVPLNEDNLAALIAECL